MADRLVVMRDGRVEQIGRQEDLYQRPATPFVARFIGHSNIVEGEILGGTRLLLGGSESLALAGRYAAEGAVTLAIRPESIRIAPAGEADAQTGGTVALSTYLGAVVEHLVRVGTNVELLVRGPGLGPGAMPPVPAGAQVSLSWPAPEERIYSADGYPVEVTGGNQRVGPTGDQEGR